MLILKNMAYLVDDVDDKDDQQLIVHTLIYCPEERTAAKEVKLSSEDQALHDELVSLMHQESLAKAHNDDQRIAFEEEKRRISIAKGKEHVDSTFNLNGVFSTNSFDAEEGGVADYNNLDPTIDVPSTPTLRIHKIHPQSQIIGKSTAGVQTRRKLQDSTSNQHRALLSFIYKQNRTNHKDQQTCLFACFLSQEEPKKVSQAFCRCKLVEARQEELLSIHSTRGTPSCTWYRQEEGVGYDEVFAPVPELKQSDLFWHLHLSWALLSIRWMSKVHFYMATFHRRGICQTLQVLKILLNPKQGLQSCHGALFGLHHAPRQHGIEDFQHFSLSNGYRRGAIDKTLFLRKIDEISSWNRYMLDDIIFGSTKSSMGVLKDFEDLSIRNSDEFHGTIKPASTPIEAHKSLGKDEEGEDVDVHLYRSMIGCLMYLTASRPDIMFAVCLCARFQVTPKVSHLHAVKRIFRYLKHQPNLGLWYPKDSPFHLEAFSDSDYAGDNHDRRSTSGGCQYLGRRLVSWQCKKQTIVAISSTEAEYVAAASCCAQVLWMQNQLLDYGFNFMNTEIHIDNESTICIVKNPVFHSKTKHIQIRHHFIRDCYEQRLINVVKVHTDDNVADLLTKGFDLARFKFLVVSIGMMNP
ncbi:hypothetical protein Tco_1493309 [Tanacetum coccineum]